MTNEITPSSVLQPDVFRRMVFELAIKGHDCLAIASSLGADPDAVASALNWYLNQRSKTESDPRLVSARLDYYLLQLAPHIDSGQAWAINMALKIETLRVQLFSLNKLPPVQPVKIHRTFINGVETHRIESLNGKDERGKPLPDEDMHYDIGGVDVSNFR